MPLRGRMPGLRHIPLSRWWLAAGIAVVLALGVGGLVLATYWRGQPAADAPGREVTIAPGASLRQAAASLQRAGVIPSARLFELLARTLAADDRPIQLGTYAFRTGEGWGRILDRLRRGDTIVVRVAIPEGLPAVLVAERLNATPRLTGHVEAPEEGSVLPATYDARVGEDRAAVLTRMQQAMDRELAALSPTRSAHAVVSSRHDILTLASIVEKETALAGERRRIAGLYSNRLRIGMRLESDPTVIYPLTKGKPLGRRILRSELQADNGYNTYRIAGLPAGPITNPGRASIAAVLNPEVHDDLFMVADGSGGHVFARSFDAHLANVAKWRAFRREQGI